MNKTDQIIIDFIARAPLSSSKDIHEGTQLNIGYATVKRVLKKLNESNYIETEGKGKGTKYRISPAYAALKPIDLNDYFEKEIDERKIIESFNFDFISGILPKVDLFTRDELEMLEKLQ
jgi:predicted transcriptional regulator